MFSAEAPFVIGRYPDCIDFACIKPMDAHMLTAPGLTLVFLGVVVSLASAFVWMLWEVEQTSKPRRNSDRFG